MRVMNASVLVSVVSSDIAPGPGERPEFVAVLTATYKGGTIPVRSLPYSRVEHALRAAMEELIPELADALNQS